MDMIEMIELILPIFSIGNILFFYYCSEKGTPVHWAAIVQIVIGTLNFLLPMDVVNEKIFKV